MDTGTVEIYSHDILTTLPEPNLVFPDVLAHADYLNSDNDDSDRDPTFTPSHEDSDTLDFTLDDIDQSFCNKEYHDQDQSEKQYSTIQVLADTLSIINENQNATVDNQQSFSSPRVDNIDRSPHDDYIKSGRPKKGRKRTYDQTRTDAKKSKYTNKQYKGILKENITFVADFDCLCALQCTNNVTTDERRTEFDKFWELVTSLYIVAFVAEYQKKRQLTKNATKVRDIPGTLIQKLFVSQCI